MLFANPIPEEFALQKADIDAAIDQAVQEAAEQGFHGHANTPFILSRIKELTHGNSLPANRALIESNVAMAAKVAVEFSKYNGETSYSHFSDNEQSYTESLSNDDLQRTKPDGVATIIKSSTTIDPAKAATALSLENRLSSVRKTAVSPLVCFPFMKQNKTPVTVLLQ